MIAPNASWSFTPRLQGANRPGTPGRVGSALGGGGRLGAVDLVWPPRARTLRAIAVGVVRRAHVTAAGRRPRCLDLSRIR